MIPLVCEGHEPKSCLELITKQKCVACGKAHVTVGSEDVLHFLGGHAGLGCVVRLAEERLKLAGKVGS